MKLIKHIARLLIIIISTQFLSCKHPTTEPPEIDNFYVKIIVKNSFNQDMSGIQVSGGNLISVAADSSLRPVAVAGYKVKMKALYPDSNYIFFEDSIFMVRAATEPILGYTSLKGIYECTDPERFPSYFNPPIFNQRGETNEDLGTFKISDSAKFVLRDTATNKSQVFYRKIRKGANEFILTWNPTTPATKIPKSTPLYFQSNKSNLQPVIDSNYFRISIKDTHRHSQNLYLVREDRGTRGSDLPPPAPEFDVRFASNVYIETYPVSINPNQRYEYTIRIQADYYPLTVSWKFKCPPNFTLSAMLDGKEESRQLICDSNSIVITNSDITRLVVGIHDPSLPALWAMHQNYPNPFDDLATIKFDLPYESFVELKVLNLSGQMIKTLVNQQIPAGFYKILWDGSK